MLLATPETLTAPQLKVADVPSALHTAVLIVGWVGVVLVSPPVFDAEHDAVVPPPVPAHDHVHGPLPVTVLAVPAVQRLLVGALATVVPFTEPQVPLSTPGVMALAAVILPSKVVTSEPWAPCSMSKTICAIVPALPVRAFNSSVQCALSADSANSGARLKSVWYTLVRKVFLSAVLGDARYG